MDADEEMKFKELRHRFYRLGKYGPGILLEMGMHWTPENIPLDKDLSKTLLFQIADHGQLDELDSLIKKKEAEILEQIGHVGDPCQFCGVPYDQAKPGPCAVRKKMVQL